jgi:hypothetical protein
MSHYNKMDEFSVKMFEKYNFPKQIKSEYAIGKIFDRIIEGEAGIYIIFNDNTFVHVGISGESIYMNTDENSSSSHIFDDLCNEFPEAEKEHGEYEKLLYAEEDKQRKMQQYLRLKQEFGE